MRTRVARLTTPRCPLGADFLLNLRQQFNKGCCFFFCYCFALLNENMPASYLIITRSENSRSLRPCLQSLATTSLIPVPSQPPYINSSLAEESPKTTLDHGKLPACRSLLKFLLLLVNRASSGKMRREPSRRRTNNLGEGERSLSGCF